MMAMPFAVVGAIAGGIAYTYWRAQKKVNRKGEQVSDLAFPENAVKNRE